MINVTDSMCEKALYILETQCKNFCPSFNATSQSTDHPPHTPHRLLYLTSHSPPSCVPQDTDMLVKECVCMCVCGPGIPHIVGT